MVTSLENEVLTKMAVNLRERGVEVTVIEAITAAYEATSLPSPEQLLQLLRAASVRNEGAT